MKPFALFAALLLGYAGLAGAVASNAKTPLANGMIKVAVVVSDNANLMDIAGPWEVFQDTMLKGANGEDVMPYELYTVAPSTALLHTTGSNHPGLALTPDYAFADAPVPDIVVVGAQAGGSGLKTWLRKVHGAHKTVMSVCTGAFMLGQAGLLDGKPATTHHWYFGNFERDFPKAKLERQVRYVQADSITFTAGGLSSGIDLALHLVDTRFGRNVAQRTADYMEYQGTGWKSNRGISELTTPVTRQDWTGTLVDGTTVVVHVVTHGASPSLSLDIPAWHLADVPGTVTNLDKTQRLTFSAAGQPVTFTSTPETDADALSGMLARDGKSYPLTLARQPRTGAP